ncbi:MULTISPECIES: GNAT family N-acetyltransferase [unclassified Granulicatella]|uniref:GNAT family N-acetyltransferase n=1 Tax=unclassified Granulicatella TaxID=2630493 RepID=UPI001073E59E|nr:MULTISPECIES: GNAT family protein [unclassified Granulicatella]MBF0779926.1 GNAT family N-acetyltransferase [Granulicatella sp. 19428wC4_WM01]TFU96037.1 N-acetyltransferase [Granulicatella sp. WM01]
MKILDEFKDNMLPTVETKRLILRQRTVDDATDIFAYAHLECVANPAGFIPAKTVQDSIDFINFLHKKTKESTIPSGYGITLKENNIVIGSVDFNRRYGNQEHILELGYALHPDYWGQGIVVEAARALIDVTFMLLKDIHKIGVSHYALNHQSKRVIEKLGFIYEGICRDVYVLNGCYYDGYQYGLLRKEWEENSRV